MRPMRILLTLEHWECQLFAAGFENAAAWLRTRCEDVGRENGRRHARMGSGCS